MSAPRRITLQRRKGWRMPKNTKKVDRTTIFGNPYRAGVETYNCIRGTVTPKDAAEAVRFFEEDLAESDHWRIRAALRGCNLACWCKPGEPCHADILLKIANSHV